MRRLPVLLLVLACAIPFAGAAGLPDVPIRAYAACTGSAPTTTYCTTGDHIIVGVDLYVRAGAHYSGAILSMVTDSSGGELGTECWYSDGAMNACMDFGGNYLGTLPLRHECWSLDASNNSLAGGAGDWECGVSGTGLS